jgi:hypothetical protein
MSALAELVVRQRKWQYRKLKYELKLLELEMQHRGLGRLQHGKRREIAGKLYTTKRSLAYITNKLSLLESKLAEAQS